jgi:hypothetical protein
MIENDLFQSNYLGRDGFKWWIGQVADPVTSGWGVAKDSNTAKQAEGVKNKMYTRRCKVRILGYHTISDGDGYVLRDSDLPWAHIMVGPGLGVGQEGIGELHEYRGGENVLGFFLDGDDAQQPVIIGGFGHQPEDEGDKLKDSERNDLKDCVVRPFIPRSTTLDTLKRNHLVTPSNNPTTPLGTDGTLVPATPAKSAITGKVSQEYESGESVVPGYVGSGEFDTDSETLAARKQATVTGILRPACNPDKNLVTAIQQQLGELLKTIKSLNAYKELYLDSTTQSLQSLSNQIGGFIKTIAGYVRKFFEVFKAFLMKELGDKMNLILITLPETIKSAVSTGYALAVKAIACIFDEVLSTGIFDVISDIITGKIIGNVVDSLLCATENLVSDILNEFLGPIVDRISGTIDAILSIAGQASSLLGSALSKAASLIERVLSFFDCIFGPACPGPASWALSGPQPSEIQTYQNILNKLSIPDIPLPFGLENVPKESYSCDSNIGYLFPPLVHITGPGNAFPVVGDGKIIGIYLDEPGKGYSPLTPPAISIVQPGVWGEGGGARVRPVVDNDGNLTKIIVTNPGSGYVSQPVVAASSIIGTEDPTLLPLPKISDSRNLVGYLGEIVVLDPGFGYSRNDKIELNGVELSNLGIDYSIEIGGNGSIIQINIVDSNNFPTIVNQYPELSVVSDTGFGAKLLPFVEFLKVEEFYKDSEKVTAESATGKKYIVNVSDIKTVVNCIRH